MSFTAVGAYLGISAGAAALGAGAIATGVGVGTALYGANKQGQIAKDTNAANQASIDKATNFEWRNYLMQRGVQANGPVTTGEMPSSFTPVNSRLPLYANVNIPPPAPAPQMAQANVPLFVKRG